MREAQPTRVVIACPGLEHAFRGFESFARELFGALRGQPGLDVVLAKGSGRVGSGELVAGTLRRDCLPARALALAARRRPHGAYDVEQVAFAAALAPRLARLRPDVVFLSDLLTSRLLAGMRGWARFAVVVSNGGPWPHEHLRHADHVQELTPAALDAGLAAGADPARHTLLPLGFRIEPRFEALPAGRRAELRASLGLPRDRKVVLSVGALNRQNKRLDWLIDELARLPAPRPFLMLLGAEEAETASVRARAAAALEPGGYAIRSVPSDRVADYYRCVDMFVLASLVEAFGRVLAEAMAHGLPCVAHDGPVQRYVLDGHGRLGDLRVPGELAGLLAEVLRAPDPDSAGAERHASVRSRFGWDALAPRYARLLRDCAPALRSRR